MLDTFSILAQDNTGICNATITSGKDDDLVKLRLRQPASGAGWHHGTLVTEDSETATKDSIGLLGG